MKWFTRFCLPWRRRSSAIGNELPGRALLPNNTKILRGHVLRRQSFYRSHPPSVSADSMLPLPDFILYGNLVKLRVELTDSGEVIEFEERNRYNVHLIEEGDAVIIRIITGGLLGTTFYSELDGAEWLGTPLTGFPEDATKLEPYLRTGKVVRIRPPGNGCDKYALAVSFDDDLGVNFYTFSQPEDSSAGLIRNGDRVSVRQHFTYNRWQVTTSLE